MSKKMTISNNMLINRYNYIDNISQINRFKFIDKDKTQEINNTVKEKKDVMIHSNDSQTERKSETKSEISTKPDGTKLLIITTILPDGSTFYKNIKLCEANVLTDNNSYDESNKDNVYINNDIEGSTSINFNNTTD